MSERICPLCDRGLFWDGPNQARCLIHGAWTLHEVVIAELMRVKGRG